MDRFRGMINHLSLGGIPAIEERLQTDYQNKMHEAALHHDNAKNLAGILMRANGTRSEQAPYGINPVTGQPATAEDIQKWQTQLDSAWGNFEKISSTSKNAKPIVQRVGELLKHVIGKHDEATDPAGGQTGAIPPPPAFHDTSMAQAMGAPAQAQQVSQQSAIQKQGAEAENSAMAQVHGQQALAEWQPQKVQEYIDFINSLPEDEQMQGAMMLNAYPKGMFSWMKDQIKLVPDDPDNPSAGAHYTGISPLETMQGKTLPGFLPGSMVGRESVHKDVFGNVDTTVRTPIAPGGGRPGKGAARSGKSSGMSGAASSGTATPASGGTGTSTSAIPNRVLTHTPPPLDANGHIPLVQGANQQVIEAANQLLDDRDLKALPSKVQIPASMLARKYGWEQGKFTPIQRTMLRESTTFLDQMLNDTEALSALDEGAMSRMQLGQVTNVNPDKEGIIGRGATTLAAQNLSPKQAKFIQRYVQMVGVISGMSQLVRSGKATEATIERLKAELPNPTTVKDSKDAQQRLRNLRKEIDVALVKGSFVNEGASSGRSSAIAAPPSGSSGSSSIDDEIMRAVNGK